MYRFMKKKPRCEICGKKMKKYRDPTTKKKSSHTWKFTCNCVSKDMLLSIG